MKIKYVDGLINEIRHDDECVNFLYIHESSGNSFLYQINRYKNGNLHNEDGPAVIWYYENGTLMAEQYYKNGNEHCIDGPAKIDYNRDGIIVSELYYIEGLYYFKDTHMKHTFVFKLNEFLKDYNCNVQLVKDHYIFYNSSIGQLTRCNLYQLEHHVTELIS